MAFKNSYPSIEQWLQYGGTLGMHSVDKGLVQVEVGDSAGLADDVVCESPTVDGALAEAEKTVKQLIADAKELLEMYLSGDVKSVDQETIRITGVPPIPNPHYKDKT